MTFVSISTTDAGETDAFADPIGVASELFCAADRAHGVVMAVDHHHFVESGNACGS